MGGGDKRAERPILIFRFFHVLPKPEVWHSYCTKECNRPLIIFPPPFSNTLAMYLFDLPLLAPFPSSCLSSSPSINLLFSPSLPSLLLLSLYIIHTISKCNSLVAQTLFQMYFLSPPPLAAVCHSHCLSAVICSHFILYLCLSFNSLLSIFLPPSSFCLALVSPVMQLWSSPHSQLQTHSLDAHVHTYTHFDRCCLRESGNQPYILPSVPTSKWKKDG